MDDETPVTRPPAPATEPPTPSDAEMSRIAREAVRQPPDPRLDRQLAAMGLTDATGDAGRPPKGAAGRAGSPGVAPETVGAIERRIRRLEVAVVLLVVAVVILAVIVIARLSS